MARDHEPARPRAERLGHRALTDEVEAVGRLVEDEQLDRGRASKQADERRASPLSRAQRAQRTLGERERELVGHEELRQILRRARRPLRGAGTRGACRRASSPPRPARWPRSLDRSRKTDPVAGARRPSMISRSVVFPAPFGPTTATRFAPTRRSSDSNRQRPSARADTSRRTSTSVAGVGAAWARAARATGSRRGPVASTCSTRRSASSRASRTLASRPWLTCASSRFWLSRMRGRRAIELAAPPVALLPRLPARDVQRVLLVRDEPTEVPGVPLLGLVVLPLELGVELGQRPGEVATARLARDEEVLEVREQAAIVRRDHETARPLPQPAPEPRHRGVVEVLRRLVEQQDLGAGRLASTKREPASARRG